MSTGRASSGHLLLDLPTVSPGARAPCLLPSPALAQRLLSDSGRPAAPPKGACLQPPAPRLTLGLVAAKALPLRVHMHVPVRAVRAAGVTMSPSARTVCEPGVLTQRRMLFSPCCLRLALEESEGYTVTNTCRPTVQNTIFFMLSSFVCRRKY